MITYNINGESMTFAPLFMQKIFAECSFLLEMDKDSCVIFKNEKYYKLDITSFINTKGNNVNDFITYLKHRFESI